MDKVKLAVLHHVRDQEECHYNLSACIEKHVGVAYDTLSRIFSQNEGRTIERYHIAQKVERVKELLGYKELTLAEIAFRTGYSKRSASEPTVQERDRRDSHRIYTLTRRTQTAE